MKKADLIQMRQEHVARGVNQLIPAMVAEAKGGGGEGRGGEGVS
jgi:hypothetical protein